MTLNKATFETGGRPKPELNLESTGFLGYTGMRYRMSLPENDGMLFVFDQAAYHSFWMDGVYIPLDIIFVGEGEVVVDVHENAKPRTTTPITPNEPVRVVIEANGGWCKRNGVVKGTIITLQGVR